MQDIRFSDVITIGKRLIEKAPIVIRASGAPRLAIGPNETF